MLLSSDWAMGVMVWSCEFVISLVYGTPTEQYGVCDVRTVGLSGGGIGIVGHSMYQ